MQSPDLVIFDLDGTLLDTLASLAEAFNESLSAMGHAPHPVESYRYFIGDGARVAAERCLPEPYRTEDAISECVGLFRSYYDNRWDDAVVFPGIHELLGQLQYRVSLAVLSNKDQAFTGKMVDHYFPGVFSKATGSGTGVPQKPHPAGATLIIEALGSSPAGTWLVGDTAVDMQTAVACNIRGVGVLWGFRDADELNSGGAAALVESPLEILDLIDAEVQ